MVVGIENDQDSVGSVGHNVDGKDGKQCQGQLLGVAPRFGLFVSIRFLFTAHGVDSFFTGLDVGEDLPRTKQAEHLFRWPGNRYYDFGEPINLPQRRKNVEDGLRYCTNISLL